MFSLLLFLCEVVEGNEYLCIFGKGSLTSQVCHVLLSQYINEKLVHAGICHDSTESKIDVLLITMFHACTTFVLKSDASHILMPFFVRNFS